MFPLYACTEANIESIPVKAVIKYPWYNNI